MNLDLSRALRISVAALAVALALAASSAAGRSASSFSFGRTGGNIQPFTVTIAADGSVTATGPARPTRLELRPAALARLKDAVAAQQFFSLPLSIRCPHALPDFAARFVTIRSGGVGRRVLVRGDCSRRFDALYAALAGAVGIG
jgi:hypothetical protein